MSQLSKTRISKEFAVRFEMMPKKTKKAAGESVVDFFLKHFGKLQVAPRYRVTVEVVKSPR